MSRYTGPKIRLSRRLGVQLFGRSTGKDSKKYNIANKSYPPGEHGQSRIGKLSEYGKQLKEKQKIRFIFDITERQMRNYYKKAAASSAVTGEELMKLLEMRLDNVVFRAGFARTRAQARQIVNHALVKYNGRNVNVPSIQVKVGDKFQIREKRKNSALFEDKKKTKNMTPHWIQADIKTLSGEIIGMPGKDDFEKIVDPQLIVEYYSK